LEDFSRGNPPGPPLNKSPPVPPDEHLETPDEPQHLPEADAVFTGKAHFLGHLLDFLLRGFLSNFKILIDPEFMLSFW